MSGAIIILAAVVLPLNQVASMADILILLLFTLVNIAAITLRKKQAGRQTAFHHPLVPVSFPWPASPRSCSWR